MKISQDINEVLPNSIQHKFDKKHHRFQKDYLSTLSYQPQNVTLAIFACSIFHGTSGYNAGRRI
jgi:hypothetical protein